MSDVNLQPCCKKTLSKMKQRMDTAKHLRGVLATAQVLQIFSGRGRTANAPAALNVSMSDWQIFSRAMQTVPALGRRAAAKDTGLHMLNHHGEGDLYRFWSKLYKSLE